MRRNLDSISCEYRGYRWRTYSYRFYRYSAQKFDIVRALVTSKTHYHCCVIHDNHIIGISIPSRADTTRSSREWYSLIYIARLKRLFPAEKCPVMKNPRYGAVTCTDGNNIRSTCAFSCGTGFTMIGAPEITCNPRGLRSSWTSKPPTCHGK